MTEKKPEPVVKVICQNRKAFHHYAVDKTFEAGIMLKGAEVKSLRDNSAHLNDAYVDIKDGVPVLIKAHIPHYKFDTHENLDPERTRVLLLNKREIAKILRELKPKGYALVPLKMYFKGSHVKVEIALAKGKKTYDKREDIKKREAKRDMSRFQKARR